MRTFCFNLVAIAFVLIEFAVGDILVEQVDTKPPFLGKPLRGSVKSNAIELSIINDTEFKLVILTNNGIEISRMKILKDLELYSVVPSKTGFWFILREQVASGIRPISLVNIDSNSGVRCFSVILENKSRIFCITGTTNDSIIVTCSVLIKINEKPIKYVTGKIPYQKLKLIDPEEIKPYYEDGADPPLKNGPRQRIPE